MRLRRVTPFLLATVLLTGGLTCGLRVSGGPAGAAVASGGAAAPEAKSSSKPALANAMATPRAEPLRAGVGRDHMPQRVSPDAAALVAEIAELQMLAEGTELELDSRQWSAFAEVTLRMEAVQRNFEAEIAKATELAPGRYRLEIPGYAAAGTALRAKFVAALGLELGDGVAAEILDQLGARLEGRFGGFGVSLQTLDIEAGAPGTLADCEVTRTVTYWKSAAGGEQLAERRETHLPAWEDPSGERWGALLRRCGLAGS